MAFRPDPIKDRDWLMKHTDKNSGKPIMQLLLENKKSPKTKQEVLIRDLIPDEEEESYSKYKNQIFEKEGVSWQSNWEYQVWLILKSIVKKGIITKLERQVEYKFIHNDIYITRFVADYKMNIRLQDGKILEGVVGDAKSETTGKMQRFGIQKKLMLAFYGEPIVVFTQGKTDVEKLITEIHRGTLYIK